MNRFALALAVLALPALSHASESFYRLYDVDPKTLDSHAVSEVKKLEESCAYSQMSRLGPSPQQAAACDAQVKKVSALGSAGARAALAALDNEHGGFGGRNRLYDVVGRSGDLGLVETLVRGLEREETQGLGNARHYERTSIANALATLTYADLRGTPAIQWRAWADAHRGVDRAGLIEERAAEVEKIVATGTVEEITSAARFLAAPGRAPARARKILTALSERADLRYDQRQTVKYALDAIPNVTTKPAANPATKPSEPTAQRADIPRS